MDFATRQRRYFSIVERVDYNHWSWLNLKTVPRGKNHVSSATRITKQWNEYIFLIVIMDFVILFIIERVMYVCAFECVINGSYFYTCKYCNCPGRNVLYFIFSFLCNIVIICHFATTQSESGHCSHLYLCLYSRIIASPLINSIFSHLEVLISLPDFWTLRQRRFVL